MRLKKKTSYLKGSIDSNLTYKGREFPLLLNFLSHMKMDITRDFYHKVYLKLSWTIALTMFVAADGRKYP